jgi:copper chaperone
MKYQIDNMTCGGCVRKVTKAIQTVDASAEIITDTAQRSVEIISTKPAELFAEALVEAGYPVS